MANVLPYGFEDLSHLMDERVTVAGIEVIESAVRRSLDVHNQVMNSMLELFTERTTDYSKRYMSPVHGSLQPVDPETGRARPIAVSGYYDVAWPIYWGGTALAANKTSILKMTVAEAARRTMAIEEADRRWMRDHVLAALFKNTNTTYVDEEHGSLTVVPIANGDAVTYYKKGSADIAATDTHYFAQAADISDSANLLETIADDLREHPENDGEVVILIPTNLETMTKGLAQFMMAVDPNVQVGVGSDRLIGGGPGVDYPGLLIGYEAESKAWIVRWDALPSGYGLALMTGGDRALRMREDVLTELQGFYMDYDRTNQPFYEAQYKRGAGFGGWNRAGAAVFRIGNGAYAIPTGYEAIMG